MENFDTIIIGTGQATGTLLSRLIPNESSIAVIEGGKPGGSCVNYGCTPTKTLVASAKAIHTARQGAEYGFEEGATHVDFNRIRERMNGIRNGSKEGMTRWLESTENVTFIRDWAHFTGKDTVKAGNREIRGKKIIINTGTRASVPPIPGLDRVSWLDNAGILDLEELPSHLVIIGGGYIGIEFAQIFRRFGSEVTILQRGSQVMPREDADVAEAIRELLEKEGISVHLETETKRVREDERGVVIETEGPGGPATLQGSHLFVATGRKPNSDRLNPEVAGISTDQKGFIRVDDYCRTGVDGVFAVGDVNGKGAFTHTSVNDGEVVLDYLYGGQRTISQRKPVYALFTDPPLGRVGMTEKEAVQSGKRVMKAEMPMSKISRAKEMSETTGFVKLLVDADTDQILGASILGIGGDEIIALFAALMQAEIPCSVFRKTVLVHPTVSELMPWILDGLKPVSTPPPTATSSR